VLRQNAGDKVTVVAAGVTLHEALKAADALKAEGIGITVIDAYSIKPLGRDVIKAAAQKTEEHRHHGRRPLCRRRAGRCGGGRTQRGWHQSPQAGGDGRCRDPARPEELLAHFGIDAAAIAKKVKAL
jgi:transketolase